MAGKPQTVIHVASGDIWAGAEVQLFNLLRALRAREHLQVAAILFNDRELAARLRAAEIPVTVIDETRHGFVSLLLRLTRELRRQGATLVHTHRYKENILGALASRLGAAPSLRTVHGIADFQPGLRDPVRYAVARTELACGRHLQRRVVAVSEELATRLRPLYPPGKVTVIANGVDVDALAAIPPAADLHRDRPRFRVAALARLVDVKRIDLLLKAAQLLAGDRRFSFFVVGDGPLRQELEQQAVATGLTKRVRFLGHRNDAPAVLRTMDALVISSDHEGLPMAALEAMALGVPVIAHAVGGLPEALAFGASGRLVWEQRPECYAAAIRATAERTADTGTIIRRARDRVATHYSAAAGAGRYAALYRQLASRRRADAGLAAEA